MVRAHVFQCKKNTRIQTTPATIRVAAMDSRRYTKKNMSFDDDVQNLRVQKDERDDPKTVRHNNHGVGICRGRRDAGFVAERARSFKIITMIPQPELVENCALCSPILSTGRRHGCLPLLIPRYSCLGFYPCFWIQTTWN